MISWFSSEKIIILLRDGWYNLINTDFLAINFTNLSLAVRIGIVIAILILLKLLFVIFSRNKPSRKDSGHDIDRGDERGFLAWLFLASPKILLSIFLLAVLLAIADPFTTYFREEKKYIETRTRVDLRDLSGSMGVGFQKTGKSKAEIAAQAHLKFLQMRAGKKDRTSLWVFSDNPYMIQDFVIDDELIYLQAYDTPWELGPKISDSYDWSRYPIPKSRYAVVGREGGTILSKALQAIIKQFDEDEKKNKQQEFYKRIHGRAILILTDAAISDLNEAKLEFDKLTNRKIVVYIIFIDENAGEQNGIQLANIIPLLDEIVKRGGRYFPVSNEMSLLQAYREIDKLEKVKIEISQKSYKASIFYKFIFASIMTLIIVIPAGLILEIFNIYP